MHQNSKPQKIPSNNSQVGPEGGSKKVLRVKPAKLSSSLLSICETLFLSFAIELEG